MREDLRQEIIGALCEAAEAIDTLAPRSDLAGDLDLQRLSSELHSEIEEGDTVTLIAGAEGPRWIELGDEETEMLVIRASWASDQVVVQREGEDEYAIVKWTNVQRVTPRWA